MKGICKGYEGMYFINAKVNNMGSLLQSYGLKRILETVGCEVEYIDIKRIDKDYDLLGSYTQDFHKNLERQDFGGKYPG